MSAVHPLIRSCAAEGVKPHLVPQLRTLATVLREIAEAGPIVWDTSSHGRFRWERMSHEQRSEALDRLDELQAEARALIEAKLGVTWDSIQNACL